MFSIYGKTMDLREAEKGDSKSKMDIVKLQKRMNRLT
jgi:hypothetical protein